jgi:hypothetical protein
MPSQKSASPIKQPKINRDRARRAARCIAAATERYEMGPGIGEGIADLLTDLRHLCDRHGLDFEELSDRSDTNYLAQRYPDELEQDLRRLYRTGQTGWP